MPWEHPLAPECEMSMEPQTPRILIADDNAQNVELLEAYLAAGDWDIQTAADRRIYPAFRECALTGASKVLTIERAASRVRRFPRTAARATTVRTTTPTR